MNNYIDFPDLDISLFPVNMTIKIDINKHYDFKSQIVEIKKPKKKILYWGDIRPYIKDSNNHHIKWDGTNIWVDNKLCN